MTRKTLVGVGLILAVLAVAAFVTSEAVAQQKPGGAQPAPGKEVTLTGKVADLHCLMAGAPAEKDPTKCSECIKAGIPVVLETKEGIVFLGMVKGGPEKFAPMAGQEVEVKGKLFEKHGVKYVDVATIAKKAGEKKEEPKKDEPKKTDVKKAEEKKPEPKKDEKKPETKKDEKKPETKTK